MKLIFIFSFLLISILSKEILFINEEILVIISFLLFVTIFFNYVGEIVGQSLDEQSEEYKKKLKEVYIAQLSSLEKTKLLLDNNSRIKTKVVPVYAYLINSILNTEKKVANLSSEIFKASLENKLFKLYSLKEEAKKHLLEAKKHSFNKKYVRTPVSPAEEMYFFLPKIRDNKLGEFHGKLYSNILSRTSNSALITCR